MVSNDTDLDLLDIDSIDFPDDLPVFPVDDFFDDYMACLGTSTLLGSDPSTSHDSGKVLGANPPGVLGLDFQSGPTNSAERSKHTILYTH